MKFVCDTSEGVMKITSALNPVTRTEIRLDPPYIWMDMDDLSTFIQNFELYCQVTWHFGRLDPSEVNTSRWPGHLPPGFGPVSNSNTNSNPSSLSEPVDEEGGI